MAEKIGIIGMGLMGQAFIKNLLEAGFIIQGYDVDPKRMAQLKKQGGTALSKPADVIIDTKFLIISLPTSQITRDVLLSDNGILQAARSGLHICDTTTSHPDESEDVANYLRSYDIEYLDAAVSGTSKMAAEKDLIVIAGGKKKAFDYCKTLFSGFARNSYYMGPSGAGAKTKLVINLILAGNRLALAEGLLLGEKAGLNLDSLLTVIQDGACSSKTMVDKGPKMIKSDYSKQGQVKLSLKDSRLMLELGQKVGAPLLMTSIYSQIMQVALEKGYSEKDTVAFYEILRGMAGLEEREGVDSVAMMEMK